MEIYGWKLLIIRNHPDNFGIVIVEMFLICHVASPDDILQVLYKFMGGSPSW